MTGETEEHVRRSTRLFTTAVMGPALVFALAIVVALVGGSGTLDVDEFVPALGLVAGVVGVSWICARVRRHRPEAWPRTAGWVGGITGALGGFVTAAYLIDKARIGNTAMIVVVAVTAALSVGSWALARRGARTLLALPAADLAGSEVAVPFRVRGRSGTVLMVGVDEVRLRMLSRGGFRWRVVDASYAEVVAVDVIETDECDCVVVGAALPVPAGLALRVRVAHSWADRGERPETWLIGTDQAAAARQVMKHRGDRYRAAHPSAPIAAQVTARTIDGTTPRWVVRTVGLVLMLWAGWGLWGTWFTDREDNRILSTILALIMILLAVALLSGAAQRYVHRAHRRLALKGYINPEETNSPTGSDRPVD